MLVEDVKEAVRAAMADQRGLNTLQKNLNLVSVETTLTPKGIRISGVYESKVNKMLSKPRTVGSKLRKTKTGTVRVSGYRLPPPSFDQQIEAVEQDESMTASISEQVAELIAHQLGTLGKHLKKITLE